VNWTIPPAVTGVFAALVVATGCGGGSSTTTVTTSAPAAASPPTKAQFVARADVICAQANANIKPVTQHVEAITHGSESEIEAEAPGALRRAGALTRDGITRLEALPIPTGDAATVRKILDALNDQAADIDNIATAIGSGDASAVEAAKQAAERSKATYRGLAQGYGLKVCGAGEE
jgi:hypothetical protein